MQPSDYSIKGKMYVFGGFDTSGARFMKERGLKIRDYFWVPSGDGKSVPYYPKIEKYFMFLDVKERVHTVPGRDKLAVRYNLRFLSPEGKVITDFCASPLTKSIIEKWTIAPEHLEEV